MKIAIDARSHGDDFSGIARYAQVLLLGIDRAQPEERIAAIVSSISDLPRSLAKSSNFEWIELPKKPFGLYQQCRLPGLLSRLGTKCLHSVDVHAPLATYCSRIITIHDLIPLVFPDQDSASSKTRWRYLWKMWLRQQAHAASKVVTISASSQHDIETHLDVRSDKIEVIPPAAELTAETPTAQDVLRTRFSLKGRVVLYVGRRALHKNLVGLLRAFASMLKTTTEPLHLVIVGTIDSRYPEPEVEAARLKIANAVTFAGHVPDEDLAGFYHMAALLIFPSFYEGYGLSALEAMQFGVPVVASNRTAVPEVVGDAGILVDPADPEKMADAARSILADPALAAHLRQRGLDRASRVTPESQAAKYLQLYDDVLHGVRAGDELPAPCEIGEVRA